MVYNFIQGNRSFGIMGKSNNGHQVNDTDSRDIAYLCNMCGKCCRGIATDYTYEELLDMKENGEREAEVFIDFFKRYSSVSEALEKEPDTVAQVLSEKKIPLDAKDTEVPFYYCLYIKDGMCTCYEERPTCCRLAPASGWSVMPPGCGYKGWQYLEQDRIKGSIRVLKEKIYEVEVLEGEDAYVPELDMSLKEAKERLEKNIKPFIRYGSKGW
jgi:Fe-S-cluster containining protein